MSGESFPEHETQLSHEPPARQPGEAGGKERLMTLAENLTDEESRIVADLGAAVLKGAGRGSGTTTSRTTRPGRTAKGYGLPLGTHRGTVDYFLKNRKKRSSRST